MPINNLMDDAATVEISRAQIWQWVRHPKGILDDGQKITLQLAYQLMNEELEKIREHLDEQQYVQRKFETAAKVLHHILADDQFVEFLTLPAYQYLR